MPRVKKPIRVFFSTLSNRFYATSAYRIDGNGNATVTGKKHDVTDDIAGLINQHDIEFRVKHEGKDRDKVEPVECPNCHRIFKNGDTCGKGGCPMGGDF